MKYYTIKYMRSDMSDICKAGKFARDAKHAFKLTFGKVPNKEGVLLFHKCVRVNVISIEPGE